MSGTVDFYYDLVSPNAYMAKAVLAPEVEARGWSVRYVPVLLGGIFKATGNQPPFVVARDVPAKLAYGQLETARFVRRHGLSAYRFNPHFPLNSLLMMRGAVACERDGELEAYIDVVARCVWEDELDMSDAEIFAAALTERGMDGPSIVARTQDPEVKAALVANTEEAVARGVFGIPSMFVGDEMFFGKDRIDLVLEEIERVDGA